MECFHDWSNLLTILDIMFITMVQIVESDVTVLGQIKTDTGFYYQRLSEFPSKMATIEYTVTFNKTNIDLHCVNGAKCNVRLDIYTSQDDQNLRTKCSNNGYGQLRNENLHTPLKLRHEPYRFTKCALDDIDSDILYCKGGTTIQDYIPRHYGFSLGYHCREPVRPSLHGLSFNFTISAQTNETGCTDMPIRKVFLKCQEFYSYTSLPNFIGDLQKHTVDSWMHSFAASTIVGLIFSSNASNSQFCYKYLNELACRIAYPECIPIKKQVIHICKDTCNEILEGCFEKAMSTLQKIKKSGLPSSWRWREPINLRQEVDCDYLPSLNGPVPCYYKPVMCDPPPNVTHARIINGFQYNGTYLAKFQIEYECVDETFQMEGNSTVTCLYSGFWSETPRCSSVSSTNPLIFVLPLLILPLCLWMILYMLAWYRKRKSTYPFTRSKVFDAFVCYDVADADFAHTTIIDEFEKKGEPPFKLCIHKRDFKPSYTIKWNIWNAIKTSNSAIIVMSQSYVDSMWCRDEFEGCYVENLEDPAFRLFVIMMQPVDTLENMNEYMKSFFASKTYLEKDDPKVFERIAQYLNWVKLPKSNHGKECVKTKEGNYRNVPTTEILEMFLTSL